MKYGVVDPGGIISLFIVWIAVLVVPSTGALIDVMPSCHIGASSEYIYIYMYED
jgi:hypothetical protein